MASGDIIIQQDAMGMTSENEQLGSWSIGLIGAWTSGKFVRVTLVKDAASSSAPEESPFDSTKTYDVIIKEH